MTTSPTSLTEALPLIESVASAIAAEARSRRAGAEYDDLYQEGALQVLEGVPEDESIETSVTKAMRRYVANCARQSGQVRIRTKRGG